MRLNQLIAVALIASGLIRAFAASPSGDSMRTNALAAVTAAPRTDWAGGSYHYLMNEMRRAVRGQAYDFVIFGDSITMGWIYPAADKGWPGGREVWEHHFGQCKTANFGVSGDRTEHVLWRITHAGQADGWTARRIVVAIGINNLGQRKDTPEETLGGTKAIVAALRERHPESEIVVLGALPWRGEDGTGFAWVREYNRLLAGLQGERVSFCDISGRFLSAPDRQIEGLFRDGLHPNPAGYEVYAEELERALGLDRDVADEGETFAADIRDRLYVWGYVLDRTPSACPFVFGKTTVSLESAVSLFGAQKAMYMNSMFNRDYIIANFPKWDRECFENCIDTKLSDRHLNLLNGVSEVWCALQHGDKLGSAKRIAELSLRHRNIRGINIDDFNDGNPANAMTPDGLMEIRRAIRTINPELQVAIVTYADGDRDFDLTPYRDAIDLVSRWKWTVDFAHWDGFRERIGKVRRQVGPNVCIVQGLYLHDFGAGMESRRPLPFAYFKKTVRAACACVADGTLDGVILPQIGWYSAPTHQRHVAWLTKYLAAKKPTDL